MTSVTRLFTRPFGHSAADLDVAFACAVPEASTTTLLAACTGCDAATVQGWSLARRLQALLDIRLADDPDAQLPALLRCAACGQRFELELALAQCRAPVDEQPLDWTAPDGQHVQLRLPTAADVQTWWQQGLHDKSRIAAALLLTPQAALPQDWLAPLAEALAQRDPFTALQVPASCPDCGHVNAADIDLEALLLADFAARQRRLLDDVATLARAFHWSEAQILALPAWRRAHYIARLETGLLS
jgi:hypothetical protein